MKRVKRLTAVLTAVMLLAAVPVFAEPKALETIVSSDGEFEYTEDGLLTTYYGDGIAYIPSEIDDTPIVKIGEMLCFDLGISTVYTGEGIKEIGASAFEGSNVMYADIAASVDKVDDRAFANCTELETVVLNSEEISFGNDVFAGTEYIEFTVPCTADIDALNEKIFAAKGDDNFGFEKMHTALTESMTEKDIFGENMFYCEACGFKGSRFIEDISLPFCDVTDNEWYYPYLQIAFSYGIINGKTETIFDPDAGMTCAEAAKIAACIHAYRAGVSEEFQGYGDNWYDVYVDYCRYNGIIDEAVTFDWDNNATRAETAYLFSHCDVEPYYINEVPLTDIPDVDEATPFAYEILDLYNKGIAVGSNEYYAYYPESEVKRSEAAALIARILCTDMRIELPKG